MDLSCFGGPNFGFCLLSEGSLESWISSLFRHHVVVFFFFCFLRDRYHVLSPCAVSQKQLSYKINYLMCKLQIKSHPKRKDKLRG